MDTPTAYLDSCVLSHLRDVGEAAPSQEMLDALERITDDATINLVTSETTLAELNADGDQTRRVSNKLLYRLLTKVEQNPIEHFLPSGMFGGAAFGTAMFGGGGGSYADPLAVELGKVLPDPPDVEHIFQAVKNGCTYFVTIDERSILRKVRANEAVVADLCPDLMFVQPEELAARL